MIAAIRIPSPALLADPGVLAAIKLIATNAGLFAMKIAYFGWMPVAVEMAIALGRTRTAAPVLAALHLAHREK